MRPIEFLTLGLATAGIARGDPSDGPRIAAQRPIVDEDADWMTRHMAEEHHIADFDAASFFILHDYDADGRWEAEEILRTYGLMDESNSHVSQRRKDEIVREVLALADQNRDGAVDRDEFTALIRDKKTLPDFGTGPGHHGDDEYEYEIHHWEIYHDENTKLEDLTHPEDIEHFKKHMELEEQEERMEAMARQAIVEANIPDKFRRDRN